MFTGWLIAWPFFSCIQDRSLMGLAPLCSSMAILFSDKYKGMNGYGKHTKVLINLKETFILTIHVTGTVKMLALDDGSGEGEKHNFR